MHSTIDLREVITSSKMMPSSPKQHEASRHNTGQPDAGDSSSGSDASPSRKRRKVTHDEKFQAMFERLYEYKKKHGDCLVPYRWAENPQLGKWVNSQRLLNDQQKLSIDRVRQLDSIGFVWRVKQRLLWDEMFNRLLAFKEKHGHLMVPQRYKEDPQLGRWVDTQRENKDRRLTPEHKKRLDDIGFVWSALKESWDEMYGRLCKYKEEHGDTMVTQRYSADPKLGKWVKNQRLRRDCLSDERVARLEEIGFVWCVQKKQQRDNWDSMYNALKKYKEQHGNCLVPIGYEGNPQLAEWVHSHRQSQGRLTAHQVKRLNAIDFEWAIPAQRDVAQVVWNCMYDKLAEYKRRHGTCDVPSTTSREDYAALALWIQTQRAAKLFGGISPQQIERLNNIGFSWQSSQDYLWNNRQVQPLQPPNPAMQAAIMPGMSNLPQSQSSAWASGWESLSNSAINSLPVSSARTGGLVTGSASRAASADLLPGGTQLKNACPWEFQPSLASRAPQVNMPSSLPFPFLGRNSTDDRVFPRRAAQDNVLLRNLLERQQQQRQQQPQPLTPQATSNPSNRTESLTAVARQPINPLPSQTALQNVGTSSQATLQNLATLNSRPSAPTNDLSSLSTAALLALRAQRSQAQRSEPPGKPSGPTEGSKP